MRPSKEKRSIALSSPCIQGKEWKYVKDCLDTEWLSSSGSYVERFERDIIRYSGARYAIACSSGTSALHICYILSNIQPQDEVIVPTVTFIAPINVVRYMGANPVFMDCDKYLNIDTNKLSDFFDTECNFTGNTLVNKKTRARIKAIVPVHVFGNPANIEPIMDLAKKYNLKVIEDAAESLGSYYTEGKYKNKKTGTVGDFGCYSFNGNKIITTGGGGMIVTNDPEHARRALYLTTQAKDDRVRSIHNEIGYNYRMTNMQAAIGCAQLERISQFIEVKRRNFLIYKNTIAGRNGLDLIGEPSYAFSNFWFYSLLINEREYGLSRDGLMAALFKKNIQCRPLWRLNHLQSQFKDCQAYKIEKAYGYYSEVMNIPCSVNLTKKDIKRVVQAIT